MSGYEGLNRIADEATRAAVKRLFDRVNALETKVTALEAAALQNTANPMDAGGQRLSNLAAPTADSDAVTKSYLREVLQTEAARIT